MQRNLVLFLLLVGISFGSIVSQDCQDDKIVGFLPLTYNQLRDEIRSSAAEIIATNQTPIDSTTPKLTSPIGACSTEEINEIVNTTLDSVLVDLEDKLNIMVKDAVQEATENLTDTLQQLLKPITSQLGHLESPGLTPSHPASSCREILQMNPQAQSGYYYIRGKRDTSLNMYCDMTRSCGGVTGGWMQVAKFDMTDENHECPLPLAELQRETSPTRLCKISTTSAGCSSVPVEVHGIKYEHVCGRIIGYQYHTVDGIRGNSRTLEEPYLEGISLTHGHPRKHIWSFIAALDEIATHYRYGCPCTNIHYTTNPTIPSYVGNDYFCDTGSESNYQDKLYTEDPLWDGSGCGNSNACCVYNNPPWFSKELSSPTIDDIEMRLCRDEPENNENVLIEIVELYVN